MESIVVFSYSNSKGVSEVKVKVKQSGNRPGVVQRVPGSLGSQISVTFGT
jgi:hypothetical protein